jgi:hypothetical protein
VLWFRIPAEANMEKPEEPHPLTAAVGAQG